MALLCMDKQGPCDFQDLYKDVYKYEVLGGLHSLTARKQILNDDPSEMLKLPQHTYVRTYKFYNNSTIAYYYAGNPHFKTAKAVIYCGLTDEEALRVAARHNVTGHFHHSLTHQDYVSIQYIPIDNVLILIMVY